MNEFDESERFNRLRLKGMDGGLSPDEQVELDAMMRPWLDGEGAAVRVRLIGI